MNLFWLTPATIKSMYGENFKSVANFSLTHIIELLICLLTVVVVCYIYKKSNEKTKNNILIFVNVLIIIDELVKDFATIPTGQWIWNYLPLHLCSINIFVCTAHTITKSDKIKDFLYALCLPGAILALLVSPWFTAPVLNVMHLHSYTIHVLLILYTMLCLADGYKPNYRNIPFNGLILLFIGIPMYFLNKLLDTNFLYINKPEEIIITKIMADYLGNYYVLLMPILVLIVWSLLYLPWYLKERKNNV